jgi:hypothetical protein
MCPCQVYCGRHYNDLFKARCAACDESIMEDSYVKAEGSAWHRKHFCCFLCDEHLAGKQYAPIAGKPHCVSCYNKLNPPVATAAQVSANPAAAALAARSLTTPEGQVYDLAAAGGDIVVTPQASEPPQPSQVVRSEYATASRARPPPDSGAAAVADNASGSRGKRPGSLRGAAPPPEAAPQRGGGGGQSDTLRSSAPPPEVAPQRGVSVRHTAPRLAGGGSVSAGGAAASVPVYAPDETNATDGKKRPQSMRTHGGAMPGGGVDGGSAGMASSGSSGGEGGAAATTADGKKRPQSMRTHGVTAESGGGGGDKGAVASAGGGGGKVGFDLSSVKVILFHMQALVNFTRHRCHFHNATHALTRPPTD